MRLFRSTGIVFTAACLSVCYAQNSVAEGGPSTTQQAGASAAPDKLMVTVGKSMIIDSPVNIQRISVANGDLVEAVAVNPKEVLINGKQAGETSLIIWQQGGNRLLYDLTVRMSTNKLDAIRQQIARDYPNDEINVTYENDTPFVRGVVKDTTAADRVMSIAATLGKPVNLLRVNVPPAETQILLKVRFADVDRAATQDLGINIVSGAFNQATAISTGQYTPPVIGGPGGPISISDALNILLFRKDINLAATIKALESKRLLETLAEPNVLATDGKPASFISGGEFPFPMVQGGASVGTVTISFREYGIKINFLPRITPRGTIQLQVTPEVSALDFANAVTFQGFTIPALSTRRVNTEVELESGQSFVIAGLLDNTMTETLNKIPGLANIPLFGNLFKSRSRQKNNTELMVLVTPEVVRPIPAGQPTPQIHFPSSFLPPNSDVPMQQPGIDKTGPVPVKPPSETMPIEDLIQQRKEGQAAPPPTMQPMMLVPVPTNPTTPGQTTAPTPPTGGTGK
ncbi:MAG TPA: pilus assembly protein N-terminal domain-containing protein [Candidatus Acidoferrales bacterium]|nr:pilus assembly protein N-terminal domain-containing protein [Candidatus Acidoferrales bacterium]